MYLFCCQNCQYSHQFQNYQPGQQVSCPRCQTPFTLPSDNPSEAHARIDLRLEILEKIGEGGMGLIFRARDKQLGREGALKVLKRDISNEEQVQRFFREARITARLDHPTIPPVYQVGQTVNGDHFILMKLISGTTLENLLFDHHRGTPEALDQRQLLEILVKVSHAVEYAHRHDIIHRDLKPDNIMVGEFGDVTLMDWGIAKDIQSTASSDDLLLDHSSKIQLNPSAALEAGLTVAGSILGTPGYMSPEQVLDSSQVDTGTDIYALGAILSTILTGFPPVDGDSVMNKMINTMKGNIIFPIQRTKLAPIELDTLVRNCVLIDQQERIQSASHFIAELSAYLASEELTLYEYGLGERLKRHVAQHPRYWIFQTLSFFLVTLTLTALLLFQLSQPNFSPTSSPPPDMASEAERFMRDAEFDAKQGKTEGMRTSLEEALKIQKSEERLFEAARLSILSGDLDLARRFLRESISSYPPGYKALYQLHALELESEDRAFKITKAAKQIIESATSRREFDAEIPYVLAIKALQEHEKKNYPEAFKYHDKAIQLDPNNPSFYVGRAYTYIVAKKQAKALTDYIKVIQLAPTARNYTDRGNLYEAVRDFEKALDDQNQALKLNPNYSRAYENRGFAYIALKQDEKALADFAKAIELGAASQAPYIQRAAIFSQKNELDRAISSYTSGIRQFPDKGSLYFLRAKIQRRKKQYRESLLDLNRAIELFDNYGKAEAYNQFGLIKFETRFYQDSLEAFNLAIKCNPKLAVAYYNRGFARLNSGGNKQQVLADYTRCLQYAPNTKTARFDRAKLYASLNQLNNAYNDLLIFVKDFPNDWDGHYSLGQILSRKKRYSDALKSANRSLQINPKNVDVQNFRATTLFLMGREEEAIIEFTKIIRARPKYLNALFNRSQIYFSQKKYKEALADLTLNITKTPSDPKVYQARGKLLQTMRLYRRAWQDFEKVLQLQPNHPKARELRGKIAKLMKLAP
ncbi:MAG: protein kinase [Planctomycetota bacterium]|nr:protein kinase [Planctomycetota bacterium]